MAYETTSVPATQTQGDIRDTLTKHDCKQFRFSEQINDDGGSSLMVEFVKDDHLVRVAARAEGPDPEWLDEKAERARTKTRDQIAQEESAQEVRRMWRVVYWSLKTRMEAIEDGLETFVQAFLPHVVDPATGLTLWQRLRPHVDDGALSLGGTGLPELEMGS